MSNECKAVLTQNISDLEFDIADDGAKCSIRMGTPVRVYFNDARPDEGVASALIAGHEVTFVVYRTEVRCFI